MAFRISVGNPQILSSSLLSQITFVLIILLVSNKVYSCFALTSTTSTTTPSSSFSSSVPEEQTSPVSFVQIDLPPTARVVHQVDKRFLSVALDSYDLYLHWNRIDLTNDRLRTLTKYLQPAYLRIGGTAQDALEFSNGTLFEDATSGNEDCDDVQRRNVIESNTDQRRPCRNSRNEEDIKCDGDAVNDRRPLPLRKFNGMHLLQLSEFMRETKLDLIFGLNILHRNNSHWNSSNAFQMMKFMSTHQIPVAGWELGNEPNLFPDAFNTTILPKYVANDLSRLRHVLRKFDLYKDSLVIGPDTTNPEKNTDSVNSGQRILSDGSSSSKPHVKFLRDFLKHVDPESIDKVSFHHYYFDGRTSKVADFLNITIMNSLRDVIISAKSLTNKMKPGKALWIGETSDAWSGGTPQVSNTFASIFMWLDKLGQSALNGVEVVIRESLIGGWYGLVGGDGNPSPSYFVSLLYKRFVGEQVLSLRSSLLWLHHQNKSHMPSAESFRSYAHCTKPDVFPTAPGAVTLYIANPSNESFLVQVEGRAGVFIQEYLLQAPNQNLMSTQINLNGKLLRIASTSNHYPILRPPIRTRKFSVPPFSAGFWILKYSNVNECKIARS